jgi:hypothetical protein
MSSKLPAGLKPVLYFVAFAARLKPCPCYKTSCKTSFFRSLFSEIVVPATSYLVAYRIVENALHVLAILHGAQDWPESF